MLIVKLNRNMQNFAQRGVA